MIASPLPVGLHLRDRPVLVAGGGPEAAETVRLLLAEGAEVRAVARQHCEDLLDLAAADDRLRLIEREVAETDLDDVWLVAAAQGSEVERSRLAGWAQQRRLWCLGASAPSARLMPHRAVADVRIGVLTGRPERDRTDALLADIDHLVEDGAFDLRRTPSPAATDGGGHVTLVGGGPGDPGLITVTGRRALAQADVIVTDRLGPVGVLEHVRAGVEVIDVGKTPGHHPVPQHEINALLVDHARRGRAVVRLKGGDPFLLGRGGEEVQACRAAGVPVTVVPGISSAISVPGLAGIPLTQRHLAHAVHITSGHAGLDPAARQCLAEGTATVVVLMGVSNLGSIVEQARAAGASPSLPAAIIERGSTPQERITRAPLTRVVAEAALVGVRAPAVIVLGAVAAPDLLERPPTS